MQTVAILESHSVSSAARAVGGLPALTLITDTAEKMLHLLRNMRVDLLVCDLETENLDLQSLVSIARGAEAGVRVILSGSHDVAGRAAVLVSSGIADSFIPKPWQPMAIKHAISRALSSGPSRVASSQSGAKIRLERRAEPRKIKIRKAGEESVGVPISQSSDNMGRYRIDAVLGEGGVGRVCLAYDLLLGMNVAIKFLNSDLTNDESAVEALKAETRICLQLQHKHIVRIYNLEKRGANYLLIMEYIKGDSLHALLANSPHGLPVHLVAQIIAVMTDALGYAHRCGILHKDITPSNVLITEDGILKVIDFGIAGYLDHSSAQQDDFIVGTPVYMSPEQIRGDALTCRSDIYSLGVLAVQLLTGSTLHSPETSVRDLAYAAHPPIEGLPCALTQTLEKATAFAPEERWESMESFGRNFAAAAEAAATEMVDLRP